LNKYFYLYHNVNILRCLYVVAKVFWVGVDLIALVFFICNCKVALNNM